MVSSPSDLRPPTPEDLGAAVTIHCDPKTNPFRPGGAPPEHEIHAALDSWLAHWASHSFGYWAVVHWSTGTIAGFGGVMEKSIGKHRFGLNLYYRLSPEFWGCGLATHIGRCALEMAFRSLGADEVFGRVQWNNVPSRKVLERLGMVPMDSEPDADGGHGYLIYSMTKARYEGGSTQVPGSVDSTDPAPLAGAITEADHDAG